eukprot:m.30871 g.30871  ORF g.30871 m.30871 type:complete len:317 (-) comp12263_c0_seq2:54-1004(-)
MGDDRVAIWHVLLRAVLGSNRKGGNDGAKSRQRLVYVGPFFQLLAGRPRLGRPLAPREIDKHQRAHVAGGRVAAVCRWGNVDLANRVRSIRRHVHHGHGNGPRRIGTRNQCHPCVEGCRVLLNKTFDVTARSHSQCLVWISVQQIADPFVVDLKVGNSDREPRVTRVDLLKYPGQDPRNESRVCRRPHHCVRLAGPGLTVRDEDLALSVKRSRDLRCCRSIVHCLLPGRGSAIDAPEALLEAVERRGLVPLWVRHRHRARRHRDGVVGVAFVKFLPRIHRATSYKRLNAHFGAEKPMNLDPSRCLTHTALHCVASL